MSVEIVSGRLQAVPFERFLAFHQSFDGEGQAMGRVCFQCGGRCEQQKIGTLMPGEKEFIANQLGISVPALEAASLDRLITPRGEVDVLKLGAGCSFLNACYQCTLARSKVKPVLCEIYPVVFQVEMIGGTEQEPALEVRFLVDEIDCPLMHPSARWAKRTIRNPHWQRHREYFQTTGIERLRQVGVPAAWYWIADQYDSENFDYRALERLRHVPVTQYDTFTLEELLACRIERGLV